jgi:hypothetical protein
VADVVRIVMAHVLSRLDASRRVHRWVMSTPNGFAAHCPKRGQPLVYAAPSP